MNLQNSMLKFQAVAVEHAQNVLHVGTCNIKQSTFRKHS